MREGFRSTRQFRQPEGCRTWRLKPSLQGVSARERVPALRGVPARSARLYGTRYTMALMFIPAPTDPKSRMSPLLMA